MKTIVKYLKVYRSCLRNTLVRDMEYRLNFFIWGIAMGVECLINVVFFTYIYGNITEIAGWEKYQMFFYLGVAQTILTIFMIFIFPNIDSLPWVINSGGLDHILLKPINSQFYMSVKNANYGYVVNLVVAVILIIYGVSGMEARLMLPHLLIGILYAVVGVTVLYSIFFIANTLAIWLKRAEFASTMFFGLWSFLRNPSSVFSNILRIVFTYIFPILLICSLPCEVMINMANLDIMIFAFAIAAVWLAASILIWRMSLKHYSSASS